MHWRKYFDERFIGSWDLEGKGDVTVTIERVEMEAMHRPDSEDAENRPVLFFNGAKKGMVLNKTNAKTIAKLHGPDTDDWVGKKITLYATETSAFGEQVECIRVRSRIKTAAAADLNESLADAAPSDGGEGEEQEVEDALL